MPKLETTITEIKQETPNVRSFYLNVEGEMTFKPGQHVIVFQETGKYHMGRPYSITTIPEELPKLGLCIKHYPGGKMTDFLFERRVGDKLRISQAFGRLTLRDKDKPIVFLATGTGIAPIVSLMKKILKEPIKHKIHLLFGAVTEKDIIYNDLFRKWESENELFYFIPCLSNPSESWQGRKGYVQQNLDAVPNWIENDFYLVGIHQMVEDTRKVLLDAGIPKEQIFTETE